MEVKVLNTSLCTVPEKGIIIINGKFKLEYGQFQRDFGINLHQLSYNQREYYFQR